MALPIPLWTIDRIQADRVIPDRAAELVSYLRGLSKDYLGTALGAPAGLHRVMYGELAPASHPELAGNYRGADYDTLRESVVAHAFTETEGTPPLVPPGMVASYMQIYSALIVHVLNTASHPSPSAVTQFACVMIMLGKVHPFLDGNGHIQRLTFQALAERAGYTMRGWSIHPKPYGERIDRLKAAGESEALATALMSYLDRDGS